jgi:hypothetical protein
VADVAGGTVGPEEKGLDIIAKRTHGRRPIYQITVSGVVKNQTFGRPSYSKEQFESSSSDEKKALQVWATVIFILRNLQQ